MDLGMLAANGGNPYTVLAVFGKSRDVAVVRGLFEITRGFIERAGFQANVLAVHTSKRFGRYRAITPRLLRSMGANELTGFALGYIPTAEDDGFALRWLEGETMRGAFVVAGRTRLFSPKPDVVVPLVLELASVYPFIYGYQYVIDAGYGPGFHAVGVFCSSHSQRDIPPLADPERRRTSEWSKKSDVVVAKGLLRDVFPLNLLTEVHRRRLINGVPLFDWIDQDNSRGRLEQLTPTLWAWHVPDERCVELGDAFEAAGLLASNPDD